MLLLFRDRDHIQERGICIDIILLIEDIIFGRRERSWHSLTIQKPVNLWVFILGWWVGRKSGSGRINFTLISVSFISSVYHHDIILWSSIQDNNSSIKVFSKDSVFSVSFYLIDHFIVILFAKIAPSTRHYSLGLEDIIIWIPKGCVGRRLGRNGNSPFVLRNHLVIHVLHEMQDCKHISLSYIISF